MALESEHEHCPGYLCCLSPLRPLLLVWKLLARWMV